MRLSSVVSGSVLVRVSAKTSSADLLPSSDSMAGSVSSISIGSSVSSLEAWVGMFSGTGTVPLHALSNKAPIKRTSKSFDIFFHMILSSVQANAFVGSFTIVANYILSFNRCNTIWRNIVCTSSFGIEASTRCQRSGSSSASCK